MSSYVNARAIQQVLLRIWPALFVLPCLAQPVVTEGGVDFDQLQSKATLAYSDAKGPHRTEFSSENKIKLRLDDEVSADVSVASPNLVLFKYSAREIVKTPTDNKVAADTLAEAFTGFIGNFTAAKTNPTPPPGVAFVPARAGAVVTQVLLEDLDLEDLARRIAATDKTWNATTATIDKLLTASTIEEAKKDAAGWLRNLPSQDPSPGLNRIPALWLKFISLDTQIRCAVVYSDRFIDDCTEKPGALVSKLQAKGVDRGKAEMYFGLTVAINSERENLLAQVADIAALAEAISKTDKIPLAKVPHDQENNQDLTIDVEASTRFERLLSKSAKDFRSSRVGAYTITFSPYELVHFRPSLGVIYSFVKSPKFSTARNEEGELTIAGETDEYAEYSGLIAMDIVRDKYVRKGIQLFGQIGIAPKADNLGIALGGGIRAYKSFTFSIGAVYQRVDKLAEGLAVGDVITEESDLKTKKEFKLGFYVGVAVKLD